MGRKRQKSDTQPKYPYTTRPAALRKLLKAIPEKPKPGKLTLATLKTWNVISTNDATPLGVLKKLGMVGSSGEPLNGYADFMKAPPAGPRSLGTMIKEHYKDVFESSHEPHKDTQALRQFFNINAGGSEKTIDLQIQTFKALCEFADFSGESGSIPGGSGSRRGEGTADQPGAGGGTPVLPPVKIDLHIHLPENKTTRDYEAIIQDIAKYIYGRGEVNRG